MTPSRNSVDSDFSALLGVLGADFVMMLMAYFDESGTHDGSPVTCVGGYLFKHQNALQFSRAWGRVLREHNLPYFRMSECAQGFGNFQDRTMDERITVEKKLIELTKRHALFGAAVTVSANLILLRFQGRWVALTRSAYCGVLRVWLAYWRREKSEGKYPISLNRAILGSR